MGYITDDEMAERADALRAVLGITADAPEMLDVLAQLKFQRFLSDYPVLPDSRMNGAAARYSSDERSILLSESTDVALRAQHPRARWTVAHEVGHLALRHGSRNRLASGAQRSDFDTKLNQEESDAHRFAACFLVPAVRAAIRETTTAEEIAARFLISNQAATRRLVELQVQLRRQLAQRRPLPDKVIDFLAEAARRGHPISGQLREEVITRQPLPQYEGDPCPNPTCRELKMVRRGLECVCAVCGTRTSPD